MSGITDSQKILLEKYPHIDTLGLDTNSPSEVDEAVRNHDTDDSLFEYLWLELSDHDKNIEDALQSLNTAIDDLQEVQAALDDHLSNQPNGPS